jgi:cyclopropane fatty-acyl-phospholipid synthase-like methyltransferase
MGAWLAPKPGMLLLDYGCGIGRMAKALIEGFGCQVIGVDVSHSMRILAHAYVRSDRFTAVSPTILATLIERGLVCDAALSVWVLQHTARPADDMETMRRALKPGARITVVNTNFRSVPSREHGWGDDRVDVEALLRRHFAVGRIDKLSAEVLAPGAVEKSFIAELINDPPAIAHG